MKSPINEESVEYIRTNLFKIIYDDESIINLFDLAKKLNFFTSIQLNSLISEVDNIQIKILIIAKIYPNVLDRSKINEFKRYLDEENFTHLIRTINTSYDRDLIYKDDENLNLYKRCVSKFDENPLIFIKKLRERQNYENTIDNNETNKINLSTSNVEEDAISQNDLNKLIKEIKGNDMGSKSSANLVFKNIRNIMRNKTISVNDSIKLLKLMKNENVIMEFILAVYPCLNDPHRIEVLLNYINTGKLQNECRMKLIKLPNYYFDIIGEENSEGACCCVIF